MLQFIGLLLCDKQESVIRIYAVLHRYRISNQHAIYSLLRPVYGIHLTVCTISLHDDELLVLQIHVSHILHLFASVYFSECWSLHGV